MFGQSDVAKTGFAVAYYFHCTTDALTPPSEIAATEPGSKSIGVSLGNMLDVCERDLHNTRFTPLSGRVCFGRLHSISCLVRGLGMSL
jgi:hypothetical protein